MLICRLYYFFGEESVQIVPPIFTGLFGFLKNYCIEMSLYILDKSPLTDLCFANPFSQAMACLLFS